MALHGTVLDYEPNLRGVLDTKEDRSHRYAFQLDKPHRWASVSGLSGDCIAVRYRGEAGISEDHERTLRSLALYGCNDARIGWMSDPTFWGQVQKVRDFVYVLPVGAPGDRLDAGSPMIANVDQFGDSSAPGEFLFLDDGEYVQALRTAGRISIIWSCHTDGSVVVDDLLAATQGSPLEDGGTVVLLKPDADDNYEGEGTGAEVCDFVRRNPHLVGAFALQFPGFSFSWRSGARRRSFVPQPMSECGMIFKSQPREEINVIIRRTATKGVERYLDDWWPRLDLLRKLR